MQDREGPEDNPASLVLGIASLLTAAAVCSATCFILYLCYNPVPWSDMWEYWAWVRKYQGHLLWHLAAQHNEHRLAVARLFFLFDQYAFGGTQKALAVLIPLIQVAHAAALALLAFGMASVRRSTAWFLAAVALACLFSSQQFANFTWYFQIQFVAVYCGATFSCVALLQSAKQEMRASEGAVRGRWWLWVTVVLAVGTTYSMANGLLIWPVLVALGIALRIKRSERVLLTAAGILFWLLYFIGYTKPAESASPLHALAHLPKFLLFFVTVIGSPFADLISAVVRPGEHALLEGLCAAAGSAGLLLSFTWIAIWRANDKGNQEAGANTQSNLVYFHIWIFVLLSILLIASGRFSMPLSEALTSRYTTPALLYWLLLVTPFIVHLEHTRRPAGKWLSSSSKLVTLALLIAFMLFDAPDHAEYARSYQGYLSETEAAMSNNVFDPEAWTRVKYKLDWLLSLTDFLRERSLSVYHQPWRGWLGDNIAQHYRVSAAGSCQGNIDRVTAIRSVRAGYKLEGWAWRNPTKKSYRLLLITDGEGIIAGSGLGGLERRDVATLFRASHAITSGWQGYVSGLDHRQLRVYMVLGRRKEACLAGTHDN